MGNKIPNANLEVFGICFVVNSLGYALHCFDTNNALESQVGLKLKRSSEVVGRY